ncbi:MAG: DUF5682 family protein [Pseudomonadota bacterium]
MADDGPNFERLRADLFQPDRGLYVVPIRHHSPACAWHLQRLIAEVQPKHILIEAPQDFAAQIPLLLDKATKPPVALVALVDPKGDRPRVAGYYPFCAHSPEYVALKEGQKVGAALEFIDAPAADKALGAPPEQTEPVVLTDEQHFDSNDYVRALSKQVGCRDGFELWDHLFETQLATGTWREFFGEVGVYCLGIRAATPEASIAESGDLNREAHMANAVLKALDDGGPVVVVVGGFHAAPLVDPQKQKPETTKEKADCYLVRYGFRALDALNGYAAGLPQPGYYQHLWERAETDSPDWRDIAIGLLSRFSDKMRDEGNVIALPSQVEAIRVAEALARMRGRPGALRHDLIDGVKAALIKGETTVNDVWTQRLQDYLCGDLLGDVPPSAGSPPLVEDVRRRAGKLRFDITDGAQRRRKLDIRRKDTHFDASRFAHAMVLIGSTFASREIGPDYLNNSRTDLLFEEWVYAWSPQVEGHLIECAVLGDDLPTAGVNLLHRMRMDMVAEGNARDLPELVRLLSRGLLAGLGPALAPFLSDLAGDIRNFGTFDTVTHALQRLMFTQRSTGPMRAPEDLDVESVVAAAYERLVYLCDELPRTTEEQVSERLGALRVMTEILRDAEEAGLDPELLQDALDRVTDETTDPVILGAMLAICVQARLRGAEQLTEALEGRLTGVSLDLPERIGLLRGILHTSPMLLWHAGGLLDVVDRFLCDIPEDEFLELLPHLRLAFTALNPREVDKLAAELAGIHQVQTGELLSSTTVYGEADLTRALQLERSLRAGIESDGLGGWLLEGAAQ